MVRKILQECQQVMAAANASVMKQQLAFIDPGLEVIPHDNVALIEAPCQEIALELRKNWRRVAEIAERCWFDLSLITYPGCIHPMQVPTALAQESVEPESPKSELFVPQLELTFDEFYQSDIPIYINDKQMHVAFANKAALLAQQKNRHNFFGESVYLLNPPSRYDNEIGRRVERIESGDFLSEYPYKALRWFLNPELEEYQRKEMDFSSNFGQVDWLGEPCWFSMVLDAQQTGVII